MKLARDFCVWAIALGASNCLYAAADTARDRNLLFGAVVDGICDPLPPTLESLSAWAANFAVETVVGLGSSLLSKATEQKEVVRKAHAVGHFYEWQSSKDGSGWVPAGGCVRFWLARPKFRAVQQSEADYGSAPRGQEKEWETLTARWAELGFTEQPYLYGEVRLATSPISNVLTLEPVVLFARRSPDATGFLRNATSLIASIDLKSFGSEKGVGTHLIEFPDVGDGPILIRGASTRGLGSELIGMPEPPQEMPRAGDVEAGLFGATVTFTSTSDATFFGKVAASAFEAQKGELKTALLPSNKAEQAKAKEEAIKTAFGAVADVFDAQNALAAAADDAKVKAALLLQKAQYIANLRLHEAGLPARYVISGP